jgi:hypothetical protein
LLKSLKNIAGKFKSSPVFSENSPKVNTFLFLLIVSYFVVGADLSKEIARERGEFKFFAAILTQSNTVDTFSYLDYLLVDPPIIGEVINLLFIPPTGDITELHRSRAPPL